MDIKGYIKCIRCSELFWRKCQKIQIESNTFQRKGQFEDIFDIFMGLLYEVHFSQLIFRSLSRIAQSLSEWQHWRHGNKVLYFTRVSRDDKWNSLRHAAPMIMMSPTFHKRQKKTYSEVLSNKSTILLMNFDDMTCTSETQLRRLLKI